MEREFASVPTHNFSYYRDTVLDLFSTQVQKQPHHPAVKMGEVVFTYKEFDEHTDELAKYLRELGVGRDSLVGLMLSRSPEMIISIFATLKAGGAYIPMGPKDGVHRIEHILNDSGCRILLTQEKILKNLSQDFEHNIVNIDLTQNNWFHPLQEKNSEALSYPAKIDPSSLAYVIYTSGTTGRPKGALIEHRNLYSLIVNYVPRLSSSDRTLQSMNTTCDSSVVEIFPALCFGATLVLWSEKLSATIRDEKITHTCVTPSMTDVLNRDDCHSLEKIIIAGEKLTEEAVKKIPIGTQIYNGYGPTECTVACSNTLIKDFNKIHIGGVLNHCKIYVVKRDLVLCEIGEEGELLIGGAGVGRGYLNRPKLNSEKFILNPFGPGRVYRTGDLVKWVNSSELDFLGRIDRQVKVRGFRVELDGIEKLICSYPGVNHSFVKYDGKNLIAYLTPTNIETSLLKKYLKEELASYALPSHFITLSEFPTNPAGKIDEHNLPAPALNKMVNNNSPTTRKEIEMAQIWQQVLFKEEYPISLLDNFFDLGGNSIDSMTLIRIMQEKCDSDFPMELIYRYPVLKDFIKAQGKVVSESAYRKKDAITSWKTIILDGIKSIPSTLYFYIAYSMPSLVLLALFFYYPILAISLVVMEYFIHRFFKLPKTMFFRKIKVFLQNGKWKYKSVKVIEDYPLEKMPRTIFSIHPHGITEDHVFPFEKYLLDKNISYKLLNHEMLYGIPFSKTFFSLLAGLPAKESSYKLAEKNNYNLLITPGDAPEGFRADEEGAIALSSQKHFFKYVLETGTSLTPVYFHNNHKAFRFFNHFFQQRYNWFKKNRSCVLQPFWGRWYLPIPQKVDLLITIGAPLMVTKRENPSWEEVEELYQSYLKHLSALYKTHAPTGAELTFY